MALEAFCAWREVGLSEAREATSHVNGSSQ